MLSGLTPSPLVNSLLPALTTLPALLPLKRRAGAFCWIVCSAVALLLICSPLAIAVQTQLLVIAVLMAGLIIALGQDMSQLPLQLQLHLRRLLLRWRRHRRWRLYWHLLHWLSLHSLLPELVLLKAVR